MQTTKIQGLHADLALVVGARVRACVCLCVCRMEHSAGGPQDWGAVQRAQSAGRLHGPIRTRRKEGLFVGDALHADGGALVCVCVCFSFWSSIARRCFLTAQNGRCVKIRACADCWALCFCLYTGQVACRDGLLPFA